MREQASLLYQQLIIAVVQNKSDTVTQMAAELPERYPRHRVCGVLGALMAAKAPSMPNNLAGAQQKLQWTLEHSKAGSCPANCAAAASGSADAK